MLAFYRSGAALVKVYDADADDVYADFGAGQYWFSKSARATSDIIASAIETTCRRQAIPFLATEIVLVGGANV